MNSSKNGGSALDVLVGTDLYGVSFVLDYVNLLFDKNTVLTTSLPTVLSKGAVVIPGSIGYRDLLVDQIGRVVKSISETKSELEIRLDNDVAIVTRLDVKEGGPELAHFTHAGRFIQAWLRSDVANFGR